MVVWRVAVLVIAVGLVVACAGPIADHPASPAGEPALPLWVVDHGWHTALVVRRTDVDAALWPERDDFPAATLVEIAWGDREFYMAAEPTAWMAVKTALAGGDSVLHVAGLEAPLAARFPGSEIVELRVAPGGLAALIRFVAGEHARDAAGRAVRLQRGLYGPSWFYAARSRYSLVNTCNTWVARALQAAGVPISPSGVVTAGGVMRRIRAAAPASVVR